MVIYNTPTLDQVLSTLYYPSGPYSCPTFDKKLYHLPIQCLPKVDPSKKKCQVPSSVDIQLPIDIIRKEQDYTILADIPGIQKQNIELSIEKNLLKITATLHLTSLDDDDNNNNNEAAKALQEEEEEEQPPSKKTLLEEISEEKGPDSVDDASTTKKKQDAGLASEQSKPQYLLTERLVSKISSSKDDSVNKISYEREIQLPKDADCGSIKANLETGILTLIIPKIKQKDSVSKRVITIS